MSQTGGQTAGALVWDAVGEHWYETGVDRVVLYTKANNGIGTPWIGHAWNGVTDIEDNPEGAEANAKYADNILYLNLISAEKYKGVLKAFTYPKEFNPCIGMVNPTVDGIGAFDTPMQGIYAGQQNHKVFGLSYRTWVGNDVSGMEDHYKIHLAYNLTAAPSQQAHNTVNDSPDSTEFSWDLSSVPIGSAYLNKPTSTLVFDSKDLGPDRLQALEDLLYGHITGSTGNQEVVAATLPAPDEILNTLKNVVVSG